MVLWPPQAVLTLSPSAWVQWPYLPRLGYHGRISPGLGAVDRISPGLGSMAVPPPAWVLLTVSSPGLGTMAVSPPAWVLLTVSPPAWVLWPYSCLDSYCIVALIIAIAARYSWHSCLIILVACGDHVHLEKALSRCRARPWWVFIYALS